MKPEERNACVYGPPPRFDRNPQMQMSPMYGPPPIIKKRTRKMRIITLLIIFVSLLALFVACYKFFIRYIFVSPHEDVYELHECVYGPPTIDEEITPTENSEPISSEVDESI